MELERLSHPLFTLSIGEFIDIVKQANREAYTEILKQIAVPKKEEKELLTIKEASELIMLSKSTIYQMNMKGTIPHIKQGKRVLYKRSELLEWLNAGKVMTQDELREEAVRNLALRVRNRKR